MHGPGFRRPCTIIDTDLRWLFGVRRPVQSGPECHASGPASNGLCQACEGDCSRLWWIVTATDCRSTADSVWMTSVGRYCGAGQAMRPLPTRTEAPSSRTARTSLQQSIRTVTWSTAMLVRTHGWAEAAAARGHAHAARPAAAFERPATSAVLDHATGPRTNAMACAGQGLKLLAGTV